MGKRQRVEEKNKILVKFNWMLFLCRHLVFRIFRWISLSVLLYFGVQRVRNGSEQTIVQQPNCRLAEHIMKWLLFGVECTPE